MLGMRKYYVAENVSADPIPDMAERIKLMADLLPKLAMAVGAEREAQRKYRNAVLVRLSKIETLATMIHGAQIADAILRGNLDEKKIGKNGLKAKIFIQDNSKQLFLAMMSYIYGETRDPIEPPDRRRKWSGWEI
jgi:hypothetical protein